MTDKKTTHGFNTRVIHAARHPGQWQGATQPPVYQSVAYRHETAEGLSQAFAGRNPDDIYTRLSNPTNRALEEKLCALEGGAGAVVMASGMAAVSGACLALLRSGDEFVAGRSLFMSTWVLFTTVFKKYGLKARLVDLSDTTALEAAINERTRFVFLETIGNPALDVPDIVKLATLAHQHGLPLLVDNTLATPYLCRPLELGADAVIHSTTKYLSGHGGAPGGVVIDGGRFDWPAERFPDFKPFLEGGGRRPALLEKLWREHHINFGATQAPWHSYLTMLGLDTLAVRLERHMSNARAVADFLGRQSAVAWVNYPGLADHPFFETAARQFQGRGFGGLLTFGLQDQAACFAFINRLRLIYHLANLGDCKSLIIHPASSQYVSFEDSVRKDLGVSSEMLRLSVGIEEVADINDDIEQALKGL